MRLRTPGRSPKTGEQAARERAARWDGLEDYELGHLKAGLRAILPTCSSEAVEMFHEIQEELDARLAADMAARETEDAIGDAVAFR